MDDADPPLETRHEPFYDRIRGAISTLSLRVVTQKYRQARPNPA